MSVYPEGSRCPSCQSRGLLRAWNKVSQDEDVFCRYCGWREADNVSDDVTREKSFTLTWHTNKLACLILLTVVVGLATGLCGMIVVVLT